jgi:nucleoside-diphosphate-sugar epimerase
MKIAITGASGYIGSHVVDQALKKGYEGLYEETKACQPDLMVMELTTQILLPPLKTVAAVYQRAHRLERAEVIHPERDKIFYLFADKKK